MRDAFNEELRFISGQLVEMTRLTASALNRATQAIMDADLELAESVITADEHIDAVRRDLDNRAVDVLARQQPVATDLRILVTAMRMSSDLERMGDLARHVAKLARL
ncbi:MAG: phosphate transport system regulatory protein PhoU, partial [Actinomycetota bacterium]|nr:phosphate transport system regulatory protein PhoU [Actinomycetota bacterium]